MRTLTWLGGHDDAVSGIIEEAGFGLRLPQKTTSGSSRSEVTDAVLIPLKAGVDWAALREDPALSGTPLLGVAREASELAFAEVFARGGDDLLLLGEPADCLAKLRALPSGQEAPATTARGALIWGPDPSWRSGVSRRLRGAGFTVDFAATGEDAAGSLARKRPGVLIVDARADTAGVASALGRARELQPGLATLAVVEAGKLGEAGPRLGEGPGVGVHEAVGFDDALLFLVNEMLAGAVQERRRSPRLLFGTPVWLRPAGGERDRVGFTYTVSEGGVFVRSMAPLPVGTEAWLELSPPRSVRRVRLAATAVWNRGFGPRSQAISPPGTGFRIDGGLPGDCELWRAGCEGLLRGPLVRSGG